MAEKQPSENVLYGRAQKLAWKAMGSERIKVGRRYVTVRRAEEDPLAWWLLTEAIVSFAETNCGLESRHKMS